VTFGMLAGFIQGTFDARAALMLCASAGQRAAVILD
jgi:hypothetical protein